ncbi:hypothetical protein Tco_1358046 [Tanacetum coccineum]
MFSGSPTIQSDDSFPSSSPMKTSDSTFEEFTDEFTLPNSLPPVTTALPSPPLPPLPPSLYIPPPVDRRDDIPKSEQPPCKRLCLSTLGSRYEVGESSIVRPTRGQGIDYGFISMIDAEERR